MSKMKAAGKKGNKKGRKVASGPGKVTSRQKSARRPAKATKAAPRTPRTPRPAAPVSKPAAPKPAAPARPAALKTSVPAVPAPAPAPTTAEHAAKPHPLDQHTSEPMAGAGSEPSQILPPAVQDPPEPNSIP